MIRYQRRKVDHLGLYHLIHEFIFTNSQRDVDRTLKISSVEGFGNSLGRSLTLRLIESKMRLQRNHIEKVKFIASDIWSSLFGKSVDKLETDNEGTYIMTVNNFPLLSRISSTNSKEMIEYMQYFVVFFQAMIQSAMNTLKINSKVIVKTENQYKLFKFHVKLH